MKTDGELHVFAVVKHHNIALLFANYAYTQSLVINVEKSEEGFELICALSQLNTVNELFDEFVKNPYQSKYQLAAWEQSKPEPVISNSLNLLTVFKNNLFDHAGIFTITIFILCWLAFVFSVIGFDYVLFQEFKFYSQLSLADFLEAPYRLITPILLHFSLMHVAFNAIWWWKLGGDIESKIGTFYLIQLLVLSAIVSNVGQFLVSSANFGGLSGVVYALAGFVWCFGYLQPQVGLRLSNIIMVALIICMILGFLNWLPVSTANAAHLLGLMIGLLMAFIKSRYFFKSLTKK